MGLPNGDRFAYTPVSSLHMTVFQGTIGERRQPDYWPGGIALDVPIASGSSRRRGLSACASAK
jgi:hypothetical protein